MRVAILGVGSPAGANTAAALKAAGHRVYGTEANELHEGFAWAAAHEVLMGQPDVGWLNGNGVEVVVAQPDSLVRWLAVHQGELEARTLLPSLDAIDVCQDKSRTSWMWWNARLRERGPVEIGHELPDWLHISADQLGLPFWLRAKSGAGGRASTLVTEVAQGFHWIRYWQLAQPDVAFIAEEFLPGDDLSWTGVYHEGELVASYARRRDAYPYPHLTVTGKTGTPSVATVVCDDEVNAVAEAAVRAVDAQWHGVACVDMVRDGDGVPRPTEINAGRFHTTTGLWASAGANLADLVVRLAAHGSNWWLRRPDMSPPAVRNCYREGLRLERHFDLPARLVRTKAQTAVAA